MTPRSNPGRVAGLWYALLVLLGPLRLIYIPNKLFVSEDPSATANNLVAHAGLFRAGILSDLLAALVLIFLVLAFFRLFAGVDRHLAVLVIVFGGVMPALLNFVNAAYDLCALTVAQGGGGLLAFEKPQRDALVMLFLRLRDHQVTAAEMLWGVWLLPLAILVYKSRFLPRFLGVWLAINGCAYVLLSLTRVLAPQFQSQLFHYSQPALFGELALVLWLLVKGSKPQDDHSVIASGSHTTGPLPSL